MTGPEKFALLNERLERMNEENPLLFDLIAMGLTIVLALVCGGVVMLLDRIAR